MDAAIVSQSAVTRDRAFALFLPFSFAEVCVLWPGIGASN